MRGLVVLLLALVASGVHANARADELADEPPQPAPEVPANDDELGPVIQIEAIALHGNVTTQTEIIMRALPIAPGDILKASDRRLRDARFKLLALGFFRDVELTMHKGSARGLVVIDIEVIERGTFVLNRLWFGRSHLTPYWAGADIGDRNLLGLGISAGVGFVYAAPADVEGARQQWATEMRLADGSLRGTPWGAAGSLTLVHGSDVYRVSGDDDDNTLSNFRALPYRRFGGRFGPTYDVTALARISAALRVEEVVADVPTGVDLHLIAGESRVMTAALGFDRDTRSDPILPHSGGRFTASVEIGTWVLASDYDFTTVLARYEHWWPLRDERHTIGIRLGGGMVVGDAPRFDRLHVSDVNHMLTPRALGLVLSNASPIDFLSTRDDKPTYGELGGIATIEYAAQLFRGSGKKRVYGGDFFVGTGLWGLGEWDDDLDAGGLWSSLPIDLFIDAGVRVDTDVGIFELTFANALGRLR